MYIKFEDDWIKIVGEDFKIKNVHICETAIKVGACTVITSIFKMSITSAGNNIF